MYLKKITQSSTDFSQSYTEEELIIAFILRSSTLSTLKVRIIII